MGFLITFHKVVNNYVVSLISKDEKKRIAAEKENLKPFYERSGFPDLVFTNAQK